MPINFLIETSWLVLLVSLLIWLALLIPYLKSVRNLFERLMAVDRIKWEKFRKETTWFYPFWAKHFIPSIFLAPQPISFLIFFKSKDLFSLNDNNLNHLFFKWRKIFIIQFVLLVIIILSLFGIILL